MLRLLLVCFVLSAFCQVHGFDWKTSGAVRWALGCDFVGNDIGSVQTNGESCGGKCLERGDCTHFVWTNYNSGMSAKEV